MKDRFVFVLRELLLVISVFFVVIILLRFYEYHAIAGRIHFTYNIFKGIFYDIAAASIFSVIALMIGMLVHFWNARLSYVTVVILCCLYISISFGLMQYFSVTLLPLGADLFGYSWNDIKITVMSSGGVGIAPVLFFFLYVGLFLSGCWWATRQKIVTKIPVPLGIAFTGILVIVAVSGIRASDHLYSNDGEYYAYLNKTDFFIQRSIQHLTPEAPDNTSIRKYPLLASVKNDSTLNAYFELKKDSLPNIVFIIVEGLGRDFTGEDAKYGGFTPFLDSLATRSLYWKNALSNAGRTFGVLPSILGSLPYGKEGFMSFGNKMPAHHTLISLLKPYGYASHFFYGGNPNFDNQDIFLESQGTDYMLDETKFPASYTKTTANDDGFSWGYADADVFQRSIEVITDKHLSPRLDVYLTLSTHEPFRVPVDSFKSVFDSRIKTIHISKRTNYLEFRNIFECLLYTDQAVKDYFRQAVNLPNYNNTIFIITGDHRLIPIPADHKLSRFHVPLMIYSPMLNHAETFKNIVTHADVTPAVLNLLKHRYQMHFPDSASFISASPLARDGFSSGLDIALIRNKNETLDYIEGKYMLSENTLFEITPEMELERISDDEKQKQLTKKLGAFVGKSLYACEQNQLVKEPVEPIRHLFKFTREDEDYLVNIEAEKHHVDALLATARDLAFEKKYPESRILTRYVLNKSPNYHDARILLARTFAWDGDYDTARYFLRQVLQRSPHYEDALTASIDVEYWSGHHEQALALSQGILPPNTTVELKVREARSLMMVGKTKEAKGVLTQLLQHEPGHPLGLALLAKLQ